MKRSDGLLLEIDDAERAAAEDDLAAAEAVLRDVAARRGGLRVQVDAKHPGRRLVRGRLRVRYLLVSLDPDTLGRDHEYGLYEGGYSRLPGSFGLEPASREVARFSPAELRDGERLRGAVEPVVAGWE